MEPALVAQPITPKWYHSPAIIFDSLGMNGLLPHKVSMLVGKYLAKEDLDALFDPRAKFLKALNPLATRTLNMSKPDVLSTYIDPKFKAHLHHTVRIVNRYYETSPRSVKSGAEGDRYCMTPELVAYVMQLAKNKNIIEIAGASGENVILFSLAGARAIVNFDKDKDEIEDCQKLFQSIPAQLNRCLAIGNCMEIPKTKDLKDLLKNTNIMFCQNLIHFFQEQEKTDFFEMQSKMLSEDGIAILTVNGKEYDSNGNLLGVYAVNPHATKFSLIYLRVMQKDKNGQLIPTTILNYFDVTPENRVNSRQHQYTIYKRDASNKYVVNYDVFKEITQDARAAIKKAIDNNNKLIKEKTSRVVEAWVLRSHIYSELELADLVKRNGFDVRFTFSTDVEGHLADHPGVGGKVGVVYSKRA